MSDTPETDAAVVASGGDWSPVLRAVSQRLERERDEEIKWHHRTHQELVETQCKLMDITRERDEALMDRGNGDIATMTRNHYERILRERDEWKNKAYSYATDYTLMEAKCFRLEQQLKEYDKLKS
jgi:hypothetical protein